MKAFNGNHLKKLNQFSKKWYSKKSTFDKEVHKNRTDYDKNLVSDKGF